MNIASKYLKGIREEVSTRSDFVAAGNCKTIEEYSHATGEILGFRLAEQLFLELLKAQDEIDGTQDSVA